MNGLFGNKSKSKNQHSRIQIDHEIESSSSSSTSLNPFLDHEIKTESQLIPPPLLSDVSSVDPKSATVPFATVKHHRSNPTGTTTCVRIVTLGMLSTIAFFLYRHRVNHSSKFKKLVNGERPGSQRFVNDSTRESHPLTIHWHN
ncbi:hypothetical protein ACE6H2_000062 [Prunus campanulata]